MAPQEQFRGSALYLGAHQQCPGGKLALLHLPPDDPYLVRTENLNQQPFSSQGKSLWLSYCQCSSLKYGLCERQTVMTECEVCLGKDAVFLSLKWWHRDDGVVTGDEVTYFCVNNNFLVTDLHKFHFWTEGGPREIYNLRTARMCNCWHPKQGK